MEGDWLGWKAVLQSGRHSQRVLVSRRSRRPLDHSQQPLKFVVRSKPEGKVLDDTSQRLCDIPSRIRGAANEIL